MVLLNSPFPESRQGAVSAGMIDTRISRVLEFADIRESEGLKTRDARREMLMPGRILTVGSLNMDLVACAPRIPVVGETITGHTYFDEPGGKGANQAYAVARLGGQATMMGRVGSDDFGRRMRENLRQAGCDIAEVRVIPDCTSGIALIFVGDDGHNSIIIVPGANHHLSPQDIASAEESFHGAALVLLQLENPLPTVVAAAQMARHVGARVILDPAPAPPKPLPEELLPLVDILTPNETEAAILAGVRPGRLDAGQAAEIAAKLRERGAKTVIVKLGGQGCVALEGRTAEKYPAPKVKAVDTTAAGDVFNAGLAVALAEGADLGAACRFANLCAALSVTRMGTQVATPTRKEVAAFAAGSSASEQ
jgi:ribokinase